MDKIPFRGVLAKLDAASQRNPLGARGRKILLTKKAAEDALATLEGAPVNRAANWDAHCPENVIGKIERAWIDGDMLMVEGFVERQEKMPDGLGMSYELKNVRVCDTASRVVWSVTKTEFAGAALLARHRAAYSESCFVPLARS